MEWCLDNVKLSNRAEFCSKLISREPAASFPRIFSDPADLLGFYRFVNNSKVGYGELMENVAGESFRKANEHGGLVLAIHDTTKVTPDAKAAEIAEFSRVIGSKDNLGFLAHLSLLASAEVDKEIFGPAALRIWSRGKGVKEGERWFQQSEEVEQGFRKQRIIHLMDREADSYDLFSKLSENGYRFVIRLCYNRVIEEGQVRKLFDFMDQVEVYAERDVQLSKRTQSKGLTQKRIHPGRETRVANLSIGASQVTFKRGEHLNKSLPETLVLNVVKIFEPKPPNGEKPIEWLLVTTETIESKEEVLKVVDYYRKRWIIEEYFKALKTGCSLEKRLFESANAWYNVLVMLLPIATNLLCMRLMGDQKLSGSTVFTVTEIAVLKVQAKRYNLKLKTISDAKYVVARIGGWVKGKWPPGWQVLGRGFEKLLLLAEGWETYQNVIL